VDRRYKGKWKWQSIVEEWFERFGEYKYDLKVNGEKKLICFYIFFWCKVPSPKLKPG
jgi:hypothetical protein